MGDTMVVADLNSRVKNCGGTNTVTGQASVYGTHFRDAFVSDTVGRVILSMNEPTVETDNLVTIIAGTPKFTSAGGLVMASVNDEIIIEQDYFVLGCTGLTNTAPIVTGTNVTYVSGPDWGNHDIYYQIDINDGNGWNGSWKDLTATNLSGETIDPTNGFKLKYRIVCDTASTSNLISYIRIQTTSTLADQIANLYILDPVTIRAEVLDVSTGLGVSGARVYIEADDNGPLPYQESVAITRSGATATVTHASHGLSSGSKIKVKGAAEIEYNGIYTISIIDSNSYSYTVSGTPATPATGSPIVTAVIINETTDINGVVSDTSFPYIGDQPIIGRARKADTSPLYQSNIIAGTITSSGLDSLVFLIRDD
jgi:hypothetical protein